MFRKNVTRYAVLALAAAIAAALAMRPTSTPDPTPPVDRPALQPLDSAILDPSAPLMSSPSTEEPPKPKPIEVPPVIAAPEVEPPNFEPCIVASELTDEGLTAHVEECPPDAELPPIPSEPFVADLVDVCRFILSTDYMPASTAEGSVPQPAAATDSENDEPSVAVPPDVVQFELLWDESKTYALVFVDHERVESPLAHYLVRRHGERWLVVASVLAHTVEPPIVATVLPPRVVIQGDLALIHMREAWSQDMEDPAADPWSDESQVRTQTAVCENVSPFRCSDWFVSYHHSEYRTMDEGEDGYPEPDRVEEDTSEAAITLTGEGISMTWVSGGATQTPWGNVGRRSGTRTVSRERLFADRPSLP